MKKIILILAFLFTAFISANAAEGNYIIKYRADAPVVMTYSDSASDIGGGMQIVSAEKALALKEAGFLEICDPDVEMTLYDIAPNDPYYSRQWNLPLINVIYPWSLNLFGDDILVGIIDSGLSPNHPDIDYSRVEEGYNFAENSTDTSDQSGHGTICAGVIAAKRNNSAGISGIADKVKILPMKVADSSGSIYMSAVINAINAGAGYGCDVLNISLGAGSNYPSLETAVTNAYNSGCIVVCAAGNDTTSDPGDHVRYPAGCEYAISVGSTTKTNTRAESSVVNESIFIAAPAASIPVLTLSGGYGSSSGTSFAAPQVAAAAAIAKQLYPLLTPAQFADALAYSAKDLNKTVAGRDTEFGYGLLNLEEMTKYVSALKEKKLYISPIDEDSDSVMIRNLSGSQFTVTSIFGAYLGNHMSDYDYVPLTLAANESYQHTFSSDESYDKLGHFVWKSLESATPYAEYPPRRITKTLASE